MNYMLEDGSTRAMKSRQHVLKRCLGDTAVAVNPNDDRYKDLMGRMLSCQMLEQTIPMGDEHADPNSVLGLLKSLLPRPRPDNGFGQRRNLPQVNVMNDDGTMNELAGEFNGMDRFEARKAVIKKLERISCPC